MVTSTNRQPDSKVRPALVSAAPPAGASTVAVFDELSVGYDRGPVLHGLSFRLQEGEFLAVVGPSGCGKTTLLRSLAGQVKRFGGSVEFPGRNDSGGLRIGYVPQVETVDWNFPITVEEVVRLGTWRKEPWMPWSSRATKDRVRDTLQRLGVGELAGRQIRALSGGQQQRVFLARALAGEPDVLLLDEPTSGVDIRTRHEVMHLLLELNQAGTTIVLTTHDLNAVASHVTRLMCIADGRVVGDGTPEEVLTPEILRRTYGAEMLVMRHNGNLYVVEDSDQPILSRAAGR